MEGTVQDTLAAAQHQFVNWCLPGATNEVLLQAAQTFNEFGQYLIALLTLMMLVVMCITLYTTLLAFKYKETTRHDWLVLTGTFLVTMTMIYFWDFLRALHGVLSASPTTTFALFWGALFFNSIFVGYYLWGAVCAFSKRLAAHYRSVSEWYKARTH